MTPKRVALLAAALLGACGGDDGVTIVMTASEGPPAYGQAPFPTDAVRDGGRIAGLAQVAEILASHKAGEAPRVRSTKPPVADFDADGTLDASDPAPYDPAVR